MTMDFRFRKMLSNPLNDTIFSELRETCDQSCDSGYCQLPCLNFCTIVCPIQVPPPTPSTTHYNHPSKLKKILISTLVLLVTTFIFVCCLAVYVKFYSRPRRRPQQEEIRETHDEFLDEDHGPVIDHHIWYINTIGLQPSVINSITVCKYKRGDGLVEGTECSVCLNEFEEDETLRLLPKCSHAFHIPCIDTWLRSHTNCPMCRAPIVTNTARSASSSGANNDNTAAGEETMVTVEESDGESDREMEERNGELRIGIQQESESQGENRRTSEESNKEEDGIQPLRRSVSLDSLSAFKISQAFANVIPVERDRNSNQQLVKEEETKMEFAPKRVSGNQGLLKFVASSSVGRSLQTGPSSLKRSISCSGKLFMSRYNRN